MEDAETELTSSEPEALGADFITVELDTQPIEYVVKWAEVGSKFTISCVKKDSEEGFVPGELKTEPDDSFFAHYESVYPECIVEESVEVPPAEEEEEEELEDGHSDSDDPAEPGISQLGHHDDDPDDEVMPPPRWRGGGGGGGGGGRTGTRAPKGSGSHACHVCGKCYSHSSSLSRHVQTHGRGGAKAIAAAIASAAASAAAANQHKEEYGKAGEGKKTLACNVCGVRCNGKRLLAIHKKSHKAKRLHACSLCGKHFNHSSSLSRHRLIHKGKARPGSGAKGPRGGGGGGGAAAMAMPDLGMAMPGVGKPKKRRGGRGGKGGMGVGMGTSSGGEKQYQCTQCDKVFRNSTALSKHQVAHVRQLLNSYTQDSKDPLAKSSDLKIRLKLCSRDKPNYYTLCKKNKRSKAAARARLAAATAAAANAAAAQAQAQSSSRSPDPERPYECLHCDKRFGSAGSLARHEHTHAGEKQYTCGICRKSFVRLSNLKQHQQTHATGKLYSCLHCGKTFVHSSSFSRHKKVHSAERQAGKQRQRSRPVLDETAPLESDSE
ncbi:zinc finger protein 345 [Sardina pilchardus]|uniref:zinc finger protein 345 n=1 Tax=Sardina pilchardus TaxID=27697 RepID=UPI002E13516C